MDEAKYFTIAVGCLIVFGYFGCLLGWYTDPKRLTVKGEFLRDFCLIGTLTSLIASLYCLIVIVYKCWPS